MDNMDSALQIVPQGGDKKGEAETSSLAALPPVPFMPEGPEVVKKLTSTRKRKFKFQSVWEDIYGVKVVTRDNDSNDPVVLACQFCITFGREQDSMSSRKRKKTQNIKYWSKQLRSDKIKQHLLSEHQTQFARFQRASAAERLNFFGENKALPYNSNSLLPDVNTKFKINLQQLDYYNSAKFSTYSVSGDISVLSLQKQLIDTARKMNRAGINQGTSGSLSTRFTLFNEITKEPLELMIITPTGMEYDELTSNELSWVRLDNGFEFKEDIAIIGENKQVENHRSDYRKKASSEFRFHLEIFRRFPNASVAIHTHSKHATALACTVEFTGLPPFHYLITLSGAGFIPVCDYALYGTQELSVNVYNVLSKNNAKCCYMRNHGFIAYESSFKKAFTLVETVELLSEQYIQVLSSGLSLKLLSPGQLQDVFRKINTYGQQE